MINRDKYLSAIQDPDDKKILARVLDKAALALKTFQPVVTDFLDPYRQQLVKPLLGEFFEIKGTFFGGYEDAERKRLLFHPDYYDPDFEDFKIVVLNITGNFQYEEVTHRDFLGAVLGLGLKREKIGDIIPKNDGCFLIADVGIASHIENNLAKVHKVSVDVNEIGPEALGPSGKKVKEIKASVASLRLDAVACAGFGVSRSQMAREIGAERVKLNWVTVKAPDQKVNKGDIISVKGRGRVEVTEVSGLTKKGRHHVILHRFK